MQGEGTTFDVDDDQEMIGSVELVKGHKHKNYVIEDTPELTPKIQFTCKSANTTDALQRDENVPYNFANEKVLFEKNYNDIRTSTKQILKHGKELADEDEQEVQDNNYPSLLKLEDDDWWSETVTECTPEIDRLKQLQSIIDSETDSDVEDDDDDEDCSFSGNEVLDFEINPNQSRSVPQQPNKEPDQAFSFDIERNSEEIDSLRKGVDNLSIERPRQNKTQVEQNFLYDEYDQGNQGKYVQDIKEVVGDTPSQRSYQRQLEEQDFQTPQLVFGSQNISISKTWQGSVEDNFSLNRSDYQQSLLPNCRDKQKENISSNERDFQNKSGSFGTDRACQSSTFSLNKGFNGEQLISDINKYPNNIKSGKDVSNDRYGNSSTLPRNQKTVLQLNKLSDTNCTWGDQPQGRNVKGTNCATPFTKDDEGSVGGSRRKSVQFVDLANDLSPIHEEEGGEGLDTIDEHTVPRTTMKPVGRNMSTQDAMYSGSYAYQSPELHPDEIKTLCRTLEDQFITPATTGAPKAIPPTSSVQRRLFSATPVTRTQKSVSHFKKYRDDIARQFYKEFNNKVCGGRLPECMDIRWSEHKRTTAGTAHLEYSLKTQQYRAWIQLSSKVLDTEERLRSTLCHELCHVAAWIIDHTRKPPHGECFKKWGAIAMKCFPGITVKTCHNYDIHIPYVWTCTQCGTEFRRHSKSIDITKSRCQCYGRLQFVGKFNVDGTPAKTSKASAFSMFVSSNYSKVKERLEPKTPHSAVMKKLSEMWNQEKQNRTVPPSLF